VTPRLRAAVVIAILALGAGAAYAPVLGAGWAYDDLNLVKPSPALDDLAGLRRAVSTDLYRQAAPRLEASPYWRPLALASFWLDTRLGEAPGALHVGNLLLHVLATVLLAFVVLRRHGGAARGVAAWVAAVWWTLHPENAEPVAWISCRYELLYGAALLGLLALPWRPGPLRAALHGLLFLAGLLSKDAFGVMAMVIVADDWAERRPVRQAALSWGAIAVAISGWWWARTLIGIRAPPRIGPAQVFDLLRYYLDAVRIYFVRALVPAPLTISHPYSPGGALQLSVGGALLVGLVALAIWRRRLMVPVAVFLAGLVPVALAMAQYREVPERYFYVPSIGLALLVGELVAAGWEARRTFVRWLAPGAVGLAAVYGLLDLEHRLPDWQSDEALWTAAYQVDPLDAQANLNVGRVAAHRGDWGEARRLFEIAQRSDPRSARIAGAYAGALLETHDVARAAEQAERATILAPREPEGWFLLAKARHLRGDHTGELAAIDELLEVSPEYPRARAGREFAACEASGRADCRMRAQ
jgi:tetratricopeptide (TPR) repeat protein